LKHYVFVYGTLRKHEHNHHLMEGAEVIAEQAWTNGQLCDTGLGYPAIKESNKETVFGELYMVTDTQLQRLDRLEGYKPGAANNLYNRIQQTIFHDRGSTEAFVYVMAEHYKDLLKKQIPSGDWKWNNHAKRDQPLLYFAYGSCMDDVRFKKQGVHHFFQKVKGRGILNGYSLRFTRKAVDGGRADIVEQGGIVEGKVYELTPESLPYLCKREGVASGCYRPTFVDLTLNGELIQGVLTFTVVNKENETAPPTHYLDEILRGGSGCVSEDYLINLKTTLAKVL
jgi:gamma-glutamylcyclotransferase (GGCT)/AIG2-like uncharacterized protein YtfP/cation transport regulator ChaC